MYSSTIITLSDLNRIKNTIAPLPDEAELRKSIDLKLKEISDKKVKNWPNSLENLNKARLEFQKRKFFEEEILRRKIEEEEEKFNLKKKNMIINQAKEKMFQNQGPVKTFVNQMKFVDSLQENEIQKKHKIAIKNRWKLFDEYWEEIERKKLEDYDKKEIEKSLALKKKQEEIKNFQNEQFLEYKQKRIEELQENFVEGQIIKNQAIKNLQEEKEKLEQIKKEKEKRNLENKLENENLAKLKAELKKVV